MGSLFLLAPRKTRYQEVISNKQANVVVLTEEKDEYFEIWLAEMDDKPHHTDDVIQLERISPPSSQTQEERDHEKHLHHDQVAPEALGGSKKDLPENYYRSPQFLGTLAATCLAQVSGYLGWVLPANTISLIVAELGDGGGGSIWLAVSWQAGFAVGFLWVGRVRLPIPLHHLAI